MPRNFLVIGTQRTGSTAIAEGLAGHPRVVCGLEWTQRVAPWRKIAVARRALTGDFGALPERHRRHLAKVDKPQAGWLGFRRLFRSSPHWLIHPRLSPALAVDRLEAHLRWLRGRPDIHLVHVVRADDLAWLRSIYMARETGLYAGREYPEGRRIAIPVGEAVRRVQARRWVDRRLGSLAGGSPYLRVRYEDFLNDPQATLRAGLGFLGCDPGEAGAPGGGVRRQSRNSPAEAISNYEELREALDRRGLLANG